VGASELVLEDRPNEAIVEKARRPIDDVEWLGLRVVGSDPTRRAENCPRGQW
jgi:hypothetical protein